MARSKFEIKAQKELEASGWMVDWKIRPAGFKNPHGYQVDYFGLFDLIACQDGIVRWIAIKGACGVPGELRRGIEGINMGLNNVKEIWCYYHPVKNKKKSRNFTCRKEIIE